MKINNKIITYLIAVASLLSVIQLTGSVYSANCTNSISVMPDKILQDFNAASANVHPRILATDDDFERIRDLIATDPFMKKWYKKMYDEATDYLDLEPATYNVDGGRLLEVSRRMSKRIVNSAMVYNISGDTRFAERAIDEMLASASFPDWHPEHFLDVAEMCYGMALGYDLLYNYMSNHDFDRNNDGNDDRESIVIAIYKKAITSESDDNYYKTTTTNWNSWCYSGLSLGALAIMDSEYLVDDEKGDCKKLLSEAITNIQNSIGALSPSGAYPEGPDCATKTTCSAGGS